MPLLFDNSLKDTKIVFVYTGLHRACRNSCIKAIRLNLKLWLNVKEKPQNKRTYKNFVICIPKDEKNSPIKM